MGLYLVMGWLALIAAVPLIARAPQTGVEWLVAGGVACTIGVAFFALGSRLRYAHVIWHGLVIPGSGCHFAAVLSYLAWHLIDLGTTARPLAVLTLG
jgi:hemolysin III